MGASRRWGLAVVTMSVRSIASSTRPDTGSCLVESTPHTHLAHPIGRLGVTTADDFYTGTVAGAFGGVTTIVDFGLQEQGGTLDAAREHRLGVIDPDAVIDFGFHLIVTDVNERVLAEMGELIRSGFPSFKVYMTYGDKKIGDDDLILLLEMAGEHGGLIYAHCENDCAVTHLIERHLSEGKTRPGVPCDESASGG